MTAAAPADRRSLRFERIDDALADVDALVAAEQAGRLRCAGTWTLGQTLNHLGAWAEYAFDGTPLKIPLPLRILLRPMKRQFVYKPMRTGKRIPMVSGGTLAIEPAPTDAGLARFQPALKRLRDECPTRPHMFFGRLTHDEWINMNLRHAELHLSFMHPT